MLSRLLRIFLLCVIHLICIVYEHFQRLKLNVELKINEYRGKLYSDNDLHCIEKYVRQLKKIPSHVTFIISEEMVCYDDLAKLVIWSLMSGISFISFYDKYGQLVKNEDLLFKQVERKKTGIPGYIKWKHRLDINGYTNGTRKNITVLLFSEIDGQDKIVDLARNICKNVNNDELELSEICVDRVDRELRLFYPSMPDPELVVCFGKNCSTNGFLPWQIRLSEFYALSSLSTLSLNSFLDILQKHSKCQQRYGI